MYTNVSSNKVKRENEPNGFAYLLKTAIQNRIIDIAPKYDIVLSCILKHNISVVNKIKVSIVLTLYMNIVIIT